MAKSAAPVVGLDIGSAFIKAVEMTWRNGRPEVTALGVMPTPGDAVIQGLVIDPPALGAVVRHLLDVSGIHAKRVICSIAGPSVMTKIVPVPKMGDKELSDTMKFEIDRFVPFAQGQTIEKAYQRLPIPTPNEENMQVLLTVAVEEYVTSMIQTVQAAGLEPIAVEVEPLAVSRSLTAFAEAGRPLNDTVGIINIGHSGTELSIVTGGLLVFPRTIGIGGDSFTKALAENFGMRADAAERMKRQYAGINLDQLARAENQPDFFNDSGALSDFGIGGGAPGVPQSFDPGAARTGLNPFLQGGVPGTGFAPPAEDEPGGGSVFDLGDGGDELPGLVMTRSPKPTTPTTSPDFPTNSPASGTPTAPSGFATPSAGQGFDAHSPGLGAFDLGLPDMDEGAPGQSLSTPASAPAVGFEAPSTPLSPTPAPAMGFEAPSAPLAPTPAPATGFETPSEPLATTSAVPGFDLGANEPTGGHDLAPAHPAAEDSPGDAGFGAGAFGAPLPESFGQVPIASSAPVGSMHIGDAVAEDSEEEQTRKQVQDTLLPVLGELVTELRRSLEYYRGQNPGIPISRLLLCGGSARMPNLDQFLGNELGLPVQIADPLAHTSVAVPGAPPEWLHEVSPIIPIAVGLAERDMVNIPKDYVPPTIAQAAA